MIDVSEMKVPVRGETVLVYDETGSDDSFDEYRKRVIQSGGRVRRAVGIKNFQRHLAVYQPTFIIHMKDRV